MATRIVTIPTSQIPEQPRAQVVRLKGEASLDRLEAILEGAGNRMYKTYKDPLSFKLLDWGSKVIQVNLALALTNEESFKTEIKSHLAALHRILVDKFSGFVLHEPVLVKETGWTCERTCIESCQISGITLITHEFAKEMLAWISSLTQEVPSDALVVRASLESQIVKGNDYSQEDKESIKRSFFNTYRMSAKQAWVMFKLNQFIKEELQESEEMACFLDIIDQRAKVHVQKVKEEYDKGREELKQRFDAHEKTTQERFVALQARESALTEKADSAGAEVLKLKIQSMHQAVETQSLRYELARRTEELARVRHRSNQRDNGLCLIL